MFQPPEVPGGSWEEMEAVTWAIEQTPDGQVCTPACYVLCTGSNIFCVAPCSVETQRGKARRTGRCVQNRGRSAAVVLLLSGVGPTKILGLPIIRAERMIGVHLPVSVFGNIIRTQQKQAGVRKGGGVNGGVGSARAGGRGGITLYVP